MSSKPINITDNNKADQVLGSLVQSWLNQGIDKGKAEGMAEKERQIALNLLQLGLKLDDISKATGLFIEEIKKL